MMSREGGKRYTNATFTRRHDHEAGRHRPAKAPSEPRVCLACGALYERRRWSRADPDRPHMVAWGEQRPAMVVCPACRTQAGGVPSGYVTLSGAFLQAHQTEIVGLLKAEAERAAEDNPLGRILGWARASGDRLVVSTTTEHLAHRLGRALTHAYKGDVQFSYGHENKTARVQWHRD